MSKIDQYSLPPTTAGQALPACRGEDALVPAAADIEALAARVPGSTFPLICSRFGHDAFLKEEALVAAIISQFLETLESDQ
jgi:homoserine acetyltransferase